MNPISVEEHELLSFFEVVPDQADPDTDWPYNDYTYKLELDQFSIVFGIAPGYKDLSFTISQSGVQLYSLTALSVNDVRYHKKHDNELLEIAVSERDTIWLQLRPSLRLSQDVKIET